MHRFRYNHAKFSFPKPSKHIPINRFSEFLCALKDLTPCVRVGGVVSSASRIGYLPEPSTETADFAQASDVFPDCCPDILKNFFSIADLTGVQNNQLPNSGTVTGLRVGQNAASSPSCISRMSSSSVRSVYVDESYRIMNSQ